MRVVAAVPVILTATMLLMGWVGMVVKTWLHVIFNG